MGQSPSAGAINLLWIGNSIRQLPPGELHLPGLFKLDRWRAREAERADGWRNSTSKQMTHFCAMGLASGSPTPEEAPGPGAYEAQGTAAGPAFTMGAKAQAAKGKPSDQPGVGEYTLLEAWNEVGGGAKSEHNVPAQHEPGRGREKRDWREGREGRFLARFLVCCALCRAFGMMSRPQMACRDLPIPLESGCRRGSGMGPALESITWRQGCRRGRSSPLPGADLQPEQMTDAQGPATTTPSCLPTAALRLLWAAASRLATQKQPSTRGRDTTSAARRPRGGRPSRWVPTSESQT